MNDYIITSSNNELSYYNERDNPVFGVELRLSQYNKAEFERVMTLLFSFDNIKKLAHIIIDDATQMNWNSYKELLELHERLQEYNPETKIFVRERFNNYPLTQALQAEKKAFFIASKIADRTKDPFEQALLLHDYTSAKIYNKSNDNSDDINFIGAMTTNSIVCMGYAKIFQKICKYLGIECEMISTQEYFKPIIHCLNILRLDSEKYNIHGHYICDPTWDSTLSCIGERSYLYSAYPIQDLVSTNARHYNFFSKNRDTTISTNGEYLSEKLCASTSPIIPLATFEKALKSLYPHPEIVDKNLDYTINEIAKQEVDAENCFYTEYCKNQEMTR